MVIYVFRILAAPKVPVNRKARMIPELSMVSLRMHFFSSSLFSGVICITFPDQRLFALDTIDYPL